ncbi:MAG TPA: hypothetical protein DFI01_10175 [Bacteroidales bacterium]|nr:hypothetical protein [Bacteroidales bacterium]
MNKRRMIIEGDFNVLIYEVEPAEKEGKKIKEIMNYQEASEYLEIEPKVLYNLVYQRKIPYIGTKNKKRFKKIDLDKYLISIGQEYKVVPCPNIDEKIDYDEIFDDLMKDKKYNE